MSEDRQLVIFAEKRTLPVDEDREQEVLLDSRVFGIQDEDRALEVLLP